MTVSKSHVELCLEVNLSLSRFVPSYFSRTTKSSNYTAESKPPSDVKLFLNPASAFLHAHQIKQQKLVTWRHVGQHFYFGWLLLRSLLS